MTPEYILEIQKALNAQYNRLWQIEQIKVLIILLFLYYCVLIFHFFSNEFLSFIQFFQEMLPECAQLAHSSNANWVELLLKLKSQGDEEEVITIQCQFFYDTSKIRPSDFQISTLGKIFFILNLINLGYNLFNA